jgi:hypothetical protein
MWATGCVNLANVAPGTPANDIAAGLGKPFRIWPEANGASSWEYPQGPAGNYTYMVRVGADGRVTGVDQVLDWPFFNRLHPGMKASEIEHLIGRPYRTTYMPNLAQNVMTWRWVETVWPRCFFAFMDTSWSLVRVAVLDQETSDHGVLTSAPC